MARAVGLPARRVPRYEGGWWVGEDTEVEGLGRSRRGARRGRRGWLSLETRMARRYPAIHDHPAPHLACDDPVVFFTDVDAYVLSGNRDAFNWLRMKPSSKRVITVGGVDTRLHRYHVLPPKQQYTQEE